MQSLEDAGKIKKSSYKANLPLIPPSSPKFCLVSMFLPNPSLEKLLLQPSTSCTT